MQYTINRQKLKDCTKEELIKERDAIQATPMLRVSIAQQDRLNAILHAIKSHELTELYEGLKHGTARQEG